MQYWNRPRRAWPTPALSLAAVAATALAAHAADITPSGVRAFAYQQYVGAPGAVVKVTWNRPGHIPSSLVLGSVIWRNDFAGGLQVVGGRDGDTDHSFLDTEATRTTNAYNGTPGGDAGTRTSFTAPGLVPGQRYMYQVSTAFMNGLLGGTTPNSSNFMTNLSNVSPLVTAIAPPLVANVGGVTPGNAPQVNPAAVNLTWTQTPGADSYVIWASTSPSFKKRVVVAKRIQTVPVDLGGPITASATVDIRSGKLKSNGGVVYLSVGGYNSGDNHRPAPFGAMFSPPVAVQPETNPPPPPGG